MVKKQEYIQALLKSTELPLEICEKNSLFHTYLYI